MSCDRLPLCLDFVLWLILALELFLSGNAAEEPYRNTRPFPSFGVCLLLILSLQIEVRVVFDSPVIVTGSPRLLLDTGAYALYDSTSEDGTEV